MIGLGILILVLLILAFFILRPKPKRTTSHLHETCFKVDGKKAKFSEPPLYVPIGSGKYYPSDPPDLYVTIGNEKFPYEWKPDSIDTFTINNTGEYKTFFVDDNMTFGVKTISGPFVFKNC